MTSYLGLLPPELRALTAEYLEAEGRELNITLLAVIEEDWLRLWERVYLIPDASVYLRTPFNAGR